MNKKMKNLEITLKILIYIILASSVLIIGGLTNRFDWFYLIMFIGWNYMVKNITEEFVNWLFKEEDYE